MAPSCLTRFNTYSTGDKSGVPGFSRGRGEGYLKPDAVLHTCGRQYPHIFRIRQSSLRARRMTTLLRYRHDPADIFNPRADRPSLTDLLTASCYASRTDDCGPRKEVKGAVEVSWAGKAGLPADT